MENKPNIAEGSNAEDDQNKILEEVMNTVIERLRELEKCMKKIPFAGATDEVVEKSCDDMKFYSTLHAKIQKISLAQVDTVEQLAEKHMKKKLIQFVQEELFQISTMIMEFEEAKQEFIDILIALGPQ